MLTRLKFLTIGQRFQYKNTIFEKISLGKARSIYVSHHYKKDEEIILSHNTWVWFERPCVPIVKPSRQLQLVFCK